MRVGIPTPREREPLVTTRAARLVLGNLDVPLDDWVSGYTCQELTIGSPTIREVVNNKPDRWGTDDQTTLWGSRAVTANLICWADGDKGLDDIADLFAPFMVPGARPTLIWTRHSQVGGERSISLRPVEIASPMISIATRSIHLAFVAPDPLVYDIDEQLATAFAGPSWLPGREYNLTYRGPPGDGPSDDAARWDDSAHVWDSHEVDWTGEEAVEVRAADIGRPYSLVWPRVYPPGPGVPTTGRWYPFGGGGPTTGWIENRGAAPVTPQLRIYGPITGPVVAGTYDSGGTWRVTTRLSLVIDPGRWVDIDTEAHTMTRSTDPARPIPTLIDWLATSWPAVPGPGGSTLTLTGGTTDLRTVVEARWRNAYLS